MLKTCIKKYISTVMAVMLISSSLFTIAHADDTIRGVFQKEQSIVNFGVELMDMEDSKAFEIYMGLLGVKTGSTEIRIDFETPVELEGKTSEEIQAVDAEKLNAVADAAQIAVDAFKADYPEIFWLDIGNSKSKAIIGKGNREDGTQYYCIVGVRLILELLPEFNDVTDESYDKVVTELTQIVAATEGMGRYNTLMYFHDYLCNNIEYSSEGDMVFNIYGALIEKKSTCEGYAESFKVLCDLAGIPCITVRGNSIGLSNEEEKHMWNYCLMEDDKWYAVDVTWDDVGYPCYDFFLVGSKTVVMINDRTFAHTHLPIGDFSLTEIHSFTYPVFNETAYEYIEFMYGDVNADGKINSADALIVLKVSAKMQEAKESEFKAGDVDGKGDLNATDALYILKYAARMIDKFPVEM